MRIQMKRVSDNEYRSDIGLLLKREYGKTPNGNEVNGRWVLRSSDGEWIDMDKYSNDLADRNNLDLYTAQKEENQMNSQDLSADYHEVVPNHPLVMEKITNEYGFPQYVDLHGNAICPSCHSLVMKNRGAGCICDTCAHEAEMHMAHDWADGELREQLDEATFQGMCEEAMEEEEKHLDEESEKEAMKRFFAGEEPGFSHLCLDEENKPMTAGYGKLDDWGSWEYQLPMPAEQWQKKKDFELKVKLNGMKYKARIIPFDSNEIIKRNFVHFSLDRMFGIGCLSDEDRKEQYDYYVGRLKETKDASSFLITASVGDSVQEHNTRIYLEIVDPTYPLVGRTSEEHMGC